MQTTEARLKRIEQAMTAMEGEKARRRSGSGLCAPVPPRFPGPPEELWALIQAARQRVATPQPPQPPQAHSLTTSQFR